MVDREIKQGRVFSLNPTCLSYLNGIIKGTLSSLSHLWRAESNSTHVGSITPSPKFKKVDVEDLEVFLAELISLKVSNTSIAGTPI